MSENFEILKSWIENDLFYFGINDERIGYRQILREVDKTERQLISIYDRELWKGRKVCLDIKDRYKFIVTFFTLMKLNSSVILVPIEIDPEDFDFHHTVFISDNKSIDDIIHCDSNFNLFKEGVKHLNEINYMDAGSFVYLYTSGSTGKSRLIKKSFNNLFTEVKELNHLFEFTKGDIFYFTPPIYHIYGFLFGFMLPMYSKTPVLIDDHFAPDSIAEFVEDKNISHFISIPAYYNMFVKLDLLDYFKKCRVLTSSSAPLSLETSKIFYDKGLSITEVYGSTETGGIAYRVSSKDQDWELFSYVDIMKVKNDNDDAPMELIINSKTISVDYDKESGYNTGDIVEFKNDNRFKLLGRNTRFVKIRGKRLDLSYVVKKYIEYYKLKTGNLIIDDKIYVGCNNERIYLISEEPFPESLKNLKQHLKNVLPGYAVPRVFINQLIPRNNMGKINKSKIEEIIYKAF